MWVYLARHRRLILADHGVLLVRTPTDISISNASTVDHTSKPTEIVDSVGAKGNVKKTFVANMHGTSNTSDPSPTLVSQVTKANARPDLPTTTGSSESG